MCEVVHTQAAARQQDYNVTCALTEDLDLRVSQIDDPGTVIGICGPHCGDLVINGFIRSVAGVACQSQHADECGGEEVLFV